MARDPLRVLLSLRQHAVEQARSALGVCLKAEAAAADRVRSSDEATRRDRETGAAWQDAYRFLEMSVVRQQVQRADRRTAAAALAAAEAASADARGAVTSARTAAEAVEQLIGERAAASQAEALRREQHVLDDIARARPTSASPPSVPATRMQAPRVPPRTHPASHQDDVADETIHRS